MARVAARRGIDPRIRMKPARAVDLRVVEGTWRYCVDNRVDIAAHFDALRAARPALFNGSVYMLARWRLSDGVFSGEALRCDYATFLHWRDHGFADGSVRNVFGMGLLHGSDGALILGEMAPHTANAGHLYPPCGSLDDDDVVGGRLDVEGNIRREIHEETGFSVDLASETGWTVVFDGPRIALGRQIRLGMDGAAAVAAIERHIAGLAVSELSAVRLVGGAGDIVPDMMPPYTQAFIRAHFAQ